MPLSLSPNNAAPIPDDGERRGQAYNAEVLEGAFTTTRGAFSGTSGILPTITDDTDDIDPADLADADALEDLLDSPNLSAREQLTVDETVDHIPQPNQTEVPEDQADTVDSELASAIVIERFPFGMPGAPIPGRAKEPPAYDSQATLTADSPWAPFQSQLDWDVARWVKLRGPTSTAVSELLAIPGVCAS
jgi:hypothetical protein